MQCCQNGSPKLIRQGAGPTQFTVSRLALPLYPLCFLMAAGYSELTSIVQDVTMIYHLHHNYIRELAVWRWVARQPFVQTLFLVSFGYWVKNIMVMVLYLELHTYWCISRAIHNPGQTRLSELQLSR
jgi:hypothetical protein